MERNSKMKTFEMLREFERKSLAEQDIRKKDFEEVLSCLNDMTNWYEFSEISKKSLEFANDPETKRSTREALIQLITMVVLSKEHVFDLSEKTEVLEGRKE